MLFRATHRGTQENDLLIGGFVRNHLDTLTDADIEALEALLERPDPDLADWLTGRRPIAPEDATQCCCASARAWCDEGAAGRWASARASPRTPPGALPLDLR